MLNPGVATLTFNPPGQFVVDRLHTVPASQGLSSFSQTGCAVQVASVKDRVNDTAFAEATHKVFTPFNSNTQSAEAEWYIVPSWGSGSVKYRIIGDHKIRDQWGRCYQCEFICKEETG